MKDWKKEYEQRPDVAASYSMVRLRIFVERSCRAQEIPEPEYLDLSRAMEIVSDRLARLEAKTVAQQLAVFELLQASKDAARVMAQDGGYSQKNALTRLTDALTGIGKATKL